MAVAISRYDPAKSYIGQKAFDCGHEILNNFVARALKQQTQRNISVAYVLTEDDTTFVGFYTLMSASIHKEELSALAPGSLPHQVPVAKLSMLGVSTHYKGRGLGKSLLRHAMEVTATASGQIGMYGLYLDADDGAYDFYTKHSFVPLTQRQSPNATPLFLPTATIKQALASAAASATVGD
jgi:ribosomal protein S18 acetylase RimI-like enzyme